MRMYQFETSLSRLEYQEIAFNNAYTGFKKDYTRFKEFINEFYMDHEYQIGKTTVNRPMFDKSLNMSQHEIVQYFKVWSAKNVPKSEVVPKRKKKVV